MKLENLDLRIEIEKANMKHKELARKIGITPEWFSTLLRKPLSEENEKRIRIALDELMGENR